uniref:MFS transporter n=1 Tax=Aegilops tauschii subsp. strangulata TaxID=200361 RepID=A0A453PZ10_AEGTS
SRDTNGAEAEPGSKGPIPQQDDSGYLLTLGLGSVGGAAAVKYGSVLLPDITRPNIVEALLMVSLPMAVAALILLKLSSTSTQD